MSIKDQFKDRFEEFAQTHEPAGLLYQEEYLKLLDSIDRYHNKVMEEFNREIQALRGRNARHSLEMGFIDDLIEDNEKGEITAMMLEYETPTSDKVYKLLHDRNDLQGMNDELESALQECLEHLENGSVFNNEIVPKIESLISKHKGGNSETNENKAI